MRNFYYIFLCVVGANILLACSSSENIAGGKGKAKELSSEDQRQMDYCFFEGLKERNIGDYDAAGRMFSMVLALQPNHSASLYELANIKDYQGNSSEAISLAQRAAAGSPDNLWYHLFLTHLYSKTGKPNKASETYQYIVEHFPDKSEYYFDWAASLLNAGEYEKAIEVYDKIEVQVGVLEETALNKYHIYRKLEKLEKAKLELIKLSNTYPSEGKYLGILAEFYQETDNTQKALETYKKVLDVEPDNAMVHLSLSEYYRLNNEPEKAAGEMKKAFENENLDLETKINILLNYYASGDTASIENKQGYDLLSLLIVTHPKEAASFAIYGDFLYRDHKLAAARDMYRNALVFDNSKFVVWNQLLRVNAELEDFNSLLTDSEASLNLFPSQPTLYLYNGISHIQNKQYKKALEALKSGKALVVDNDPLLAEFYRNIGDVYHSTDQNNLSDEAFENVLRISPDNGIVLNNYSYYLSERDEQLEKAEKMSLRSNELDPGNHNFQDTYGWILFRLGKYEEAEGWLRKAIESGGAENGVILDHYGDVMYKVGRVDEAVKYWGKALKSGHTSDKLQEKIRERKIIE